MKKSSEPINKELVELEKELVKSDSNINDKLGALEISEIKFMDQNDQYMRDFVLSQPHVLKMEALNQKTMELAKKVADETIQKEQELDEYKQTNQELQYEFDEKQEKLKALYEQYKEKKESISKAAMTKMLQQKCNAMHKDSQ